MPNRQDYDPRVVLAANTSAQDVSHGVAAVAAVVAAGKTSGDLAWTGTRSHGNDITITDSQSRFSTRISQKPMWMWAGANSKNGDSGGDDTADYFPSIATVETDLTHGQMARSIRFNIAAGYTNALVKGIPVDPEIPRIEYIERQYEKDITDPDNFSSGGDYNLKTNRWWTSRSVSPEGNSYVGYQGTEGGNVRLTIEYLTNAGPAKYYGSSVPNLAWLSEEFYLKDSSGEGVRDGEIRHYRNTVWLNSDEQDHKTTTRDSTHPTGFTEVNMDQWSNSGGAPSPQYINTGLMIIDEVPGVYVGNASARADCTRLVRLPTKEYAAGRIVATLFETAVTLSSGYLYFRQDIDAWISDDGLPLT
jgi:hypothetical protein